MIRLLVESQLFLIYILRFYDDIEYLLISHIFTSIKFKFSLLDDF